jgi:two-component system, response regulator YesN
LKSNAPLFLLLGRIDRIVGLSSYVQRRELLYGIEAICRRFLCIFVSGFVLVRDNYDMLWFLQPADASDTSGTDQVNSSSLEKIVLFVRDTLETIQDACRETLDITISFVFGTESVSWEKAAQKHLELKNLMSRNIDFGSEMLMTDKSFKGVEDQNAIIDNTVMNAQLQLSKLNTLNICLEKGNKYEFHRILEETAGCLRNTKSTNCNSELEIYFSISIMFLSYINRRNLARKIDFRIGLSKLTHIEEHLSLNQALDYLHNLADIIFNMQSAKEDSETTYAVSKVTEFICNHLSEDLSLLRLADIVYFNPSYLSRLFKQITGNTLTGYIYKMKVEKAKLLLEDCSLKIHDIASAVGYDSSTYFARFFKKMTGLNPQEYRDMILKK